MKILIVANNDIGLYKFRKELLQELLKENEVFITLPDGDFVPEMVKMGCQFESCEFDRHGTNPIKELKQIYYYKKLIRRIKPDIVLTYTIKPNIYAGMACSSLKIPYVANITGLGTAVENGGLMQKITLALYKLGLKKAQKVFFQNSENRDFMVNRGIVGTSYDLLPGSGVNLNEHSLEPYPPESDKIVFLIIGRIMREKGTDELLAAAKIIKKDFPDVIFRMIGFYDGDYQNIIKSAVEEGIIEYMGKQSDIHSFIKDSYATIHASYHEGISNVLLESAACGRPVIATDVPGCRETFDEGISGIACKVRSVSDLVSAIRKFIELPYERKVIMGLAGRIKIEKNFNRSIIVNKYLDEINNIVIGVKND